MKQPRKRCHRRPRQSEWARAVAFEIACGREEEDERRNPEGWSEVAGEAERRGKGEEDDPSSEKPKQRSKAVLLLCERSPAKGLDFTYWTRRGNN